MLKFCKLFFGVIFFILFFLSCGHKTKSAYNFSENGYWYKLIAFENDAVNNASNLTIIKLNISFKTQADSVFFDNYNNTNSILLLEARGKDELNFISKQCLNANVGDSLELLIPCTIFYKQNFSSDKIPFFSAKDSVVKVNLKVLAFLSEQDYQNALLTNSNKEIQEITNFFGGEKKALEARDSVGFYWVEKPKSDSQNNLKIGDTLSLTYKGGFLNGRIIDYSPTNFKLKVGTPDQLIKGLNLVISKLKLHQNAKIILPSRLAFGQNGNVFLNIPPFTPMLYEISIK